MQSLKAAPEILTTSTSSSRHSTPYYTRPDWGSCWHSVNSGFSTPFHCGVPVCVFPLFVLGFARWTLVLGFCATVPDASQPVRLARLPEALLYPGASGAQSRFEEQGVGEWSLAKLGVEQSKESTVMLENLAVCWWRSAVDETEELILALRWIKTPLSPQGWMGVFLSFLSFGRVFLFHSLPFLIICGRWDYCCVKLAAWYLISGFSSSFLGLDTQRWRCENTMLSANLKQPNCGTNTGSIESRSIL